MGINLSVFENDGILKIEMENWKNLGNLEKMEKMEKMEKVGESQL